MSYNGYLLSIVLIPVLLSPVLPFISKKSVWLRNILALLLMLVPFYFLCLLLPEVLSGNIITFSFPFPLGINFILQADIFAVFTAMASVLISAIILFYSFEYIKSYQYQGEYYFIVVLFLGSMMGIIFSANLIFIYIFWEMTALASWRLIGFFREKEYVRRANKAFLMTAAGALFMLAGFLIIAENAGSFDLNLIANSGISGTAVDFAIALILIGIFAKSATFPFHSWLADAGIAPSPVTALLHAAVLVKIGVYVYARLFSFVIIPSDSMRTVILVVIAVSAFMSGGAALVEKDIKRVIAFSTISQIAFIFLGFVSGGKVAFAGAMLFILIHGSAKAGLFLCAGIIEHNVHTKELDKMGGLLKYMPVTALAFAFSALSVMGIPPFAGFFSKFIVIAGSVMNGNVWTGFAFIICAGLTVLYTVRLFTKVFLGKANGDFSFLHKESLKSPMLISVMILAVLSLGFGLFFGEIFSIANLAANQMISI